MWVPVTGAIDSGTSFPGSPATGLPFFRTDLGSLFVYSGSSWLAVSSLAQLADVAVSSPANGQLLQFSSGAGKWVNATVPTGVSAYDAAVLAYGSLVHYWPMNDASGASAAADAKGGSNLTVNGTVRFGARPVTRDYETSVFFDNNTSDYLTFPSGMVPASGSYTIEWAASPVINGLLGNQCLFSLDAHTNGDIFFYGDISTNPVIFANAGASTKHFYSVVASGVPVIYHVTWDGSNSRYYANGGLILTDSGKFGQSGAGKIGTYASAVGPSYTGYLAKLAIYNVALTQAQILANAFNL